MILASGAGAPEGVDWRDKCARPRVGVNGFSPRIAHIVNGLDSFIWRISFLYLSQTKGVAKTKGPLLWYICASGSQHWGCAAMRGDVDLAEWLLTLIVRW